MQAGDLVTLSAYANGLDTLYSWCARMRQHHKKPLLVGLVIKVSPPRWTGDEQMRYEVRWMEPDGPKGRHGKWGSPHFNRKDLKFVSRG